MSPHINITRRQRGYSWEKQIVDIFNKTDDWYAKRLGGTTIYLPDVIVTNNKKSILYAVEAKSGESNILYVPRDQLERCKDIIDNFLSIYEKRYIVLAFKFKATNERKLSYRIIPFKNIQIFSSLKGVSYNIQKETFYVHYTTEATTSYTEGITKLTSIAEFVNFL
jgi:Holliday junction resolvase